VNLLKIKWRYKNSENSHTLRRNAVGLGHAAGDVRAGMGRWTGPEGNRCSDAGIDRNRQPVMREDEGQLREGESRRTKIK
jgi:hypothetical protein